MCGCNFAQPNRRVLGKSAAKNIEAKTIKHFACLFLVGPFGMLLLGRNRRTLSGLKSSIIINA